MFDGIALAWKQENTGVSRLGWLAWVLEKLALAAFVTTILMLGFWRPIPLDWFSQSWAIGSRYQLVTVYNGQFQQVILYPSDLAAAATIILWGLGRITASLIHQFRVPLRIGPPYLTLPLIGLAAVSALSATQAALAILSLEMALHLLLLAALVIAISNLRPPTWTVVAPLALLLVIEGALSLAQAWAQSTLLGQFLLNWNREAIAKLTSSSVVQLPNGTRWLRAYGSLPHPNILGGLLCLAIPLIAGAYLRLRRRSLSAWLLLASLAMGLLALLLSFSRAAWLGIFISALWASLLLWQKGSAKKSEASGVPPGNPRSELRWGIGRVGEEPESAEPTLWLRARSLGFLRRHLRPILLCLLGIGLLVGLVAALGPALQSRLLLSSSSLEQRSLSERDTLLKAGAVFFIRHPWLGVGAGNMPLVELAYPSTRNIGESTHNVPIVVAVETGPFGLLLWLIPPIGALWAAWRRRAALSAVGLSASAALIALLTASQLDHYLWTEPTGSLIWWLAVALAALGGEAGGRATDNTSRHIPPSGGEHHLTLQ